jgi:hypothetical protein
MRKNQVEWERILGEASHQWAEVKKKRLMICHVKKKNVELVAQEVNLDD